MLTDYEDQDGHQGPDVGGLTAAEVVEVFERCARREETHVMRCQLRRLRARVVCRKHVRAVNTQTANLRRFNNNSSFCGKQYNSD